jgi:hypothetical protein
MQYIKNGEKFIKIGDMFLCRNTNRAIKCRLCKENIKKEELCLHVYVSRGSFNIHIHHLNEEIQNDIKIYQL